MPREGASALLVVPVEVHPFHPGATGITMVVSASSDVGLR
ncbi:hypothetical protein J2X03_002302 [Microbacterium trichothecenolyticum]|nr:hypothetical protein [Microbacterium trichothecenolyticum]